MPAGGRARMFILAGVYLLWKCRGGWAFAQPCSDHNADGRLGNLIVSDIPLLLRAAGKIALAITVTTTDAIFIRLRRITPPIEY